MLGPAADRVADQYPAPIDGVSLNRFLELGTVTALATDQVIVHAGATVDGIHLLVSGRLSAERDGHRLRELEPGDFFGSGALFGVEPSLATIRALAPSRVIFIPRDAALDHLALYPEFGMALCARLVRENRARLAQLGEVYVAHRRLTEQMETQHATLCDAVCTVEQTARLISQSPHPVLRISNAGMLLFANGPAAPILRHWGCAIGTQVPADWSELVSQALAADQSRALESTVGDRVFSFTVTPLRDLDYANVYGQDVTEARRKAAQIEHMALHDELTGLPNRAALRDRLDALVAEAAAAARRHALILVDLVDLEPIRALFGHSVSDAVLVWAAQRLGRIAGTAGMVAALGGHEFALLVEASGAAPDEAIAKTADAIVTRLSRPFEIDAHRLQVGARLGITFVGGDSTDSSAAAMKRAGLAKHHREPAPAAYSFYRPELEEALHERRALELDLQQAIGTEQIEVVFQPKVNVADGRIIGAEALARWQHPSRGMILPERFIPIAEQTGAIHQLGEQVLRIACQAATSWPDDALHIAVNLSALQLRQADIAQRISAILAETGLAPGRLELEITESLLVEDIERAAETLDRLHRIGVRLSLDDFGTGYSCLAYLANLKFDKLKIDRSFVIGMHRSPELHKIAQSIVRLGAGLEMSVVAEGIELDEQWQQLRELGCAEGQGYLFSRPLTGDQLARALRAGPAAPAAERRGTAA
ncbi:MAG TPA: EAL domain-containing protein [Candidatus Sulfotelmatobacter sp.]|nr:EAL domain-containing protein [Candidatus Sulfotelmatobacter sp.]